MTNLLTVGYFNFENKRTTTCKINHHTNLKNIKAYLVLLKDELLKCWIARDSIETNLSERITRFNLR